MRFREHGFSEAHAVRRVLFVGHLQRFDDVAQPCVIDNEHPARWSRLRKHIERFEEAFGAAIFAPDDADVTALLLQGFICRPGMIEHRVELFFGPHREAVLDVRASLFRLARYRLNHS